MKCNHCKKIIPEQEEIRIKDEFLHEECLKGLEKEKQEELLQKEKYDKKIIINTGVGLSAFTFLFALYFLYKTDDYGTTKFFFSLFCSILLATGIYYFTSSGWSILIVFIVPLIICKNNE